MHRAIVLSVRTLRRKPWVLITFVYKSEHKRISRSNKSKRKERVFHPYTQEGTVMAVAGQLSTFSIRVYL